MAWIKLDSSTPDKPEVLRMARALSVTPNALLGALMRVWFWFDSQSDDGSVQGLELGDIDAIGQQTGLADAMLAVGWLAVDERKALVLPNFQRHNGETAKRRALTAKRVSTARSRNADVTHAALQERYQSKAEQEQSAVLISTALHAGADNAIAPAGAGCAAADHPRPSDHWLATRLVEAQARLCTSAVSPRARGRASRALAAITRAGRDPLATMLDIIDRAAAANSPGGYILRAIEDEAAVVGFSDAPKGQRGPP